MKHWLWLGVVLIGAGVARPAVAPPEKLRVAVVQLADSPNLDATCARMVSWIDRAAERGARVVVFPEGAVGVPATAGEQVKSAALATLRAAAKRRSVYVVTGMSAPLAGQAKSVNSMLVIGPQGEDVFSYTKLYNLNTASMPGTFLIDGIPCNGMICADRWLRGIEEVPIQEGARISFELSGNLAVEWVPEYQWYWYVPRALRNTAWVVFSNTANKPGTPPGQGRSHGHGAIVAPDGNVIAGSREDTEAMTIADLDLSGATRAAAEARAAHPVLGKFWQAGVRIRQGEKIEAPPLTPLRSPQVAITLAVAQVSGDLAAMKRAIAEARAKGADLVAFPARSAEETDLAALQAAAREQQIMVAFGAAHREGGATFNSAFVIGADGALLTRYDQMSAHQPFATGTNPKAMWFSVKGVPAIVTLQRDALWTEIAELAAVAGARIIVHLDREPTQSAEDKLRALQVWSNHASFLTFTAIANPSDSVIWDDLRGMDEISAEYRGRPRIDSGPVEVFSPWSANIVTRVTAAQPMIVATRKIPSATNPHHPNQTTRYNPQMDAWYRLGASLIHPQ